MAILENVRFNAGETSKEDETGAPSPTSSPSWPTPSSATASGSSTASRPRSTTSPYGSRGGRRPRGGRAGGPHRLTTSPERPYVVVLGGSKVSDKLGVIDSLIEKADRLLIGGGMVFTFLDAQGHEVGRSLLEEDQVETSAVTWAGAEKPMSSSCCRPTSWSTRSSRRGTASRNRGSWPPTRCPPTASGSTSGRLRRCLRRRGPVRAHGVLERPDGGIREHAFAAGTRAVAQALTEIRRASRSSGAAIPPRRSAPSASPRPAFGHISTGGGASLEYLEGKTLPGIAILSR